MEELLENTKALKLFEREMFSNELQTTVAKNELHTIRISYRPILMPEHNHALN